MASICDGTIIMGVLGQMCKALRENEIDMVVILTEGIVWDILRGNDVSIVQVFVS